MEKSIFSLEYKQVLKQLRDAREDSGLTQSDVAERLGQTQSFVSKVERSERRLDVVELRAFCNAIGIQFSEFIAEVERRLEKPGNAVGHNVLNGTISLPQ